MRYSRDPRLEPGELDQVKGGGRAAAPPTPASAFFDRVGAESSAEARRCGLLLVGGASVRDRAVRAAQGALRFDKEPSLWSHAAVVLEWPQGAAADSVVGAEVSLEPPSPADQVPERNGVTLFRLSRYLDRDRYPHLAFATFTSGERATAETTERKSSGEGARPPTMKELKDAIVSAALEPNGDRVRYPFWDWLGPWSRWIYASHAEVSPLAQGVPLPGAAFCEYAFEAARLDLTPGATGPATCPEVLWSTLLHWHKRIGDVGGESVAVQVWSAIDAGETARVARPTSLDKEFVGTRTGTKEQAVVPAKGKVSKRRLK